MAAVVQIHYELYALREQRWTLDACFGDETEACQSAEAMRRQPSVRAIRVLREMQLPAKPDPIVTVVLDSTGAADDVEAVGELRKAKREPERKKVVTSELSIPSSVQDEAQHGGYWLWLLCGLAGLAALSTAYVHLAL